MGVQIVGRAWANLDEWTSALRFLLYAPFDRMFGTGTLGVRASRSELLCLGMGFSRTLTLNISP